MKDNTLKIISLALLIVIFCVTFALIFGACGIHGASITCIILAIVTALLLAIGFGTALFCEVWFGWEII